VLRPRLNLIRFQGVLASKARLRAQDGSREAGGGKA
jgi:hypothetical protein